MKSLKFIRGAVVALAALGVVFPQLPAMAAGPKTASKPIVRTVAANAVFDIGLSQGGAFTGRVVDHTGAAMEGAEITVKQQNKEVARSVTDKNGTFAVSGMKSGVYTVASGATEGTYRVWSEKSAPPSAKEQGLLVLGQNGARGNFGAGDGDGLLWLIGGVALTGLVLGTVGLVNSNQALARPYSP